MKKKVFIVFLFIVILLITLQLLYIFNYINHKKYKGDYFNIKTYISKIDMDSDGIDDQTDILKSAKEYIKTNPKYKSKYYETGYPNDEHGVCTDVVAFALLDSGYDLKKLVNEDIKNHRELYNIEKIDKNIDFRRVRNLKVFFKNNTTSLTTDINKIEEWQGGDIIIFENHIGIVSDTRNKKGIPFIIHNASPYQKDYEEDILEYRKDVVGHYRMS